MSNENQDIKEDVSKNQRALDPPNDPNEPKTSIGVDKDKLREYLKQEK